jgi:hypothetical protein
MTDNVIKFPVNVSRRVHSRKPRPGPIMSAADLAALVGGLPEPEQWMIEAVVDLMLKEQGP